jgi:outer membrane receptor protein involved in Fe transport
MKKIYHILTMMIAVAVFAACSSTANTGATTAKKEKDYSNLNSLADVLRTVGGIQVSGVGSDVTVLIRGQQTIMLNTQPLYVVDGMPLGNDYSMANNAVRPADIKSIQILRDKAQTLKYGEPGTNGVILIKTKSGDTAKK